MFSRSDFNLRIDRPLIGMRTQFRGPQASEAHQVGAWRWLCLYRDCLEVCRGKKLGARRRFFLRGRNKITTLPA